MSTPGTGETTWPEPMVERLKELYADGLPHSAIGRVLTKEFGCVITRCASIGPMVLRSQGIEPAARAA